MSLPLLFHLLLSCLYVGFSGANASDIISSSEPVKYSETVFSSSKKFKLSFFSPENTTNNYVGIMFNLPSPTPTVVWVANRDNPLHDSSGMLTISEDGNLVILNGQKEIIWSSSISKSMRNSTARLLDTGNLVLEDSSNRNIFLWESFHFPTDSLLPSMKMGTDKSTNTTTVLKSWRSSDDPSVGNFSIGIQPQRHPQAFIWKNSSPYWRSGPWNKQIYIGIPEMRGYYGLGLYLVDDDTGTAYQTFKDQSQDQSRIFYYSLNSTGSYQEKVWYPSKKDWVVEWANPRSECDFYGKCGPFGSCNPNSSAICSCIQGFKPKNEGEWEKGNWTSGCVRKTALDCQRNKTDVENGKQQDGFLKLLTMGVPEFAIWVPSSKKNCESDCLSNCSCVAYSYHGGIGCMHWNRSLIDIQEFSGDGAANLFIRLTKSELNPAKHESETPFVIIAITVSIAISLCGYLVWKLLANHRGRKRKCYKENMVKDDVNQVKIEDMTLYSFDMLAYATNTFHPANKLGQGGFGPVYKGQLPQGQEIAVKRLSQCSSQGLEEFMNEVSVISRLQHRNLVRLLGCCIERGEKMLVYEFMPNGSLDSYLSGSHQEAFLDWSTRANIIEGTGRGLLYLHRDSRLRIIHRDMKASNILLDEYLNPKISDFGMARIFGGNQDQAKTNRVVGTYGYMAPEYAMHGRYSEKSDVYSFGVLILEIVSGRKNSSFYDDEYELTLLAYAWKLWNENNVIKLIDPKIFDLRFEKEVVRCVHIGLLCVQEHAEDRPNVYTVLSMLTSEIAELSIPKQPAFIRGLVSSEQRSSMSQSSVNADPITVLEPR